MEVTIQRILDLYEKGVITILHGGKIYFKREKSQ